MNKVILQGNLGGDPDLKVSEGKTSVCTFSVATNEKSKSRTGEMIDVTEWHRVVTFGKIADLCAKYLKKGDPVLLEGKIRTSRWTDKEGKEQVAHKIVGDQVRFLSRRTPEVQSAGESLSTPLEEGAPL